MGDPNLEEIRGGEEEEGCWGHSQLSQEGRKDSRVKIKQMNEDQKEK